MEAIKKIPLEMLTIGKPGVLTTGEPGVPTTGVNVPQATAQALRSFASGFMQTLHLAVERVPSTMEEPEGPGAEGSGLAHHRLAV